MSFSVTIPRSFSTQKVRSSGRCIQPSGNVSNLRFCGVFTVFTIKMRAKFKDTLARNTITKAWIGSRHATSVRQGNWFSVGIGPVGEATQ